MDNSKLLELPKNALCPISRFPMEDPVICADGHSYERAYIERWLKMRNYSSPATGKPLVHTGLIANHSLRNIIQELMQRMPEVEQEQQKMVREKEDLEAIIEQLMRQRGSDGPGDNEEAALRMGDVDLREGRHMSDSVGSDEPPGGANIKRTGSLSSRSTGTPSPTAGVPQEKPRLSVKDAASRMAPALVRSASKSLQRSASVQSVGDEGVSASRVQPTQNIRKLGSHMWSGAPNEASLTFSAADVPLNRTGSKEQQAEPEPASEDQMQARRKEEAEFVRLHDQDDTDVWYLVEVDWLTAWSKFVARGGTPPRPIDNSHLLDPVTQKPKAGLKAVRDYRGVNASVWAYLHERYGGGPVLRRDKVNIYLPDIPEPGARAPASFRQRMASLMWPSSRR